MTLDELPYGVHATVTSLSSGGPSRRRMMELGVLPGAEVRIELTNPLGDPTAYRVCGSVIALRRAQARYVHVRTHGEASDGRG